MTNTLPASVVQDISEILSHVRQDWEDRLESTGYTIELEGEIVPATAELLENEGYGKALKALAAIYGDTDWRDLLPLDIRLASAEQDALED